MGSHIIFFITVRPGYLVSGPCWLFSINREEVLLYNVWWRWSETSCEFRYLKIKECGELTVTFFPHNGISYHGSANGKTDVLTIVSVKTCVLTAQFLININFPLASLFLWIHIYLYKSLNYCPRSHSSLSWPLNRLFAHAVLTVNQLNVKEKFTKLGTDFCAPARKFTSISYVIICLFSLSFSIHFLRCWQTEFGWHSTALNGDHILYSRDQNTWFRVDIVGRNYMLVTQGGVKGSNVF